MPCFDTEIILLFRAKFEKVIFAMFCGCRFSGEQNGFKIGYYYSGIKMHE